MKGAIETMVGVIMIAFMTVLSTSYIIASLNTQRAQNYHTAVVTEIEASDFADDVISDCENKAVENGYKELKINKVNTESGGSYAKVVLKYDYTLPFLNLLLEHEITGYAR